MKYNEMKSKIRLKCVGSLTLGVILIGFATVNADMTESGFIGFVGLLFAVMGIANLIRINTLTERKMNRLDGMKLNIKMRK